jgi:hypothetical protein
MSTNVTKLPQDKTPAQRAKIKLVEQFAVVFLANALLAGYVLFSSQATGQPANWWVVIIAAIGQGILALFNVLEKYFSANNEPLFSALFEAGRQEILQRAPTVQYTATDQMLQQSMNAAFQPSYAPPIASVPSVLTQVPQSTATPSALTPVRLQPIPADSTPVVAQSVPNVAPANAALSSTIPAMPVV